VTSPHGLKPCASPQSHSVRPADVFQLVRGLQLAHAYRIGGFGAARSGPRVSLQGRMRKFSAVCSGHWQGPRAADQVRRRLRQQDLVHRSLAPALAGQVGDRSGARTVSPASADDWLQHRCIADAESSGSTHCCGFPRCRQPSRESSQVHMNLQIGYPGVMATTFAPYRRPAR
jgi:hypothetical protein